MKKKSKKEIKRLTLTFMIFVPLLTIFVCNMISFGTGIYKNTKEKKELEIKYAQMLKEEDSLKSEIAKLENPEYIARYAREKYLYSKDGELIIKIGE